MNSLTLNRLIELSESPVDNSLFQPYVKKSSKKTAFVGFPIRNRYDFDRTCITNKPQYISLQTGELFYGTECELTNLGEQIYDFIQSTDTPVLSYQEIEHKFGIVTNDAYRFQSPEVFAVSMLHGRQLIQEKYQDIDIVQGNNQSVPFMCRLAAVYVLFIS